jgi:tetratricopeptide (TPR) repeat protein
MDENADLAAVAGIGPEYARLLATAEIFTQDDLRLRLSTEESRRVISWQTGVSEKLLLRWYRESFDDYDPAEALGGAGVSVAEAAMLGEEMADELPVRGGGLVAPDGALPLHRTDGQRVHRGFGALKRRILELRISGPTTLVLLALFVAVVVYASLSSALRSTASSVPALDTSSTALARVRKAGELLQEGNLDLAERLLREAILIDESCVEARTGLGRVLVRGQRFDEAILMLEKAILESPGSFEAHYFLSSAYIGADRLPEAVERTRSALALAPGHRWAAYNLGLIAQRSHGRFELTASERRLVLGVLVHELDDVDSSHHAQTVEVLRFLSGKDFGFDPDRSPDENRGARQAWSRWWEEQQPEE